jgi:sulfonate transport system substrate-binding protein
MIRQRIAKALHKALLALAALCALPADAAETIRIGYQKSSTLTVILKTNGVLEKALAPLGYEVAWREFTSGLPLLEALNVGSVDFSADVADTVPIFAQAAGAKLVFVAEEAASPHAQAIVVPRESAIKTVADLKGKKVAVTKAAGSHYLLLAALKNAGLSFSDISPAYLTPADGRSALVAGHVDAWVAWDPFFAVAQDQSGARLLADGEGLANYKRYYLSSKAFAGRHPEVLDVVYSKLRDTGLWVKAEPATAATLLSGLWGLDPQSIAKANGRRSYRIGVVTREGLSEQQAIADAFLAEKLLPARVETGALEIWSPKTP